MSLTIKSKDDCRWDLVSLGEVMLRLDPGEESPVHRHDLDHILVQIAGDKIALAPEPDTASRYKDYMEADVLPGEVAFVRRGGIEVARNIGEKQYREIIVELKDPAA